MLYATTRNNTDTFTAQRVLASRRGPDGGLYMPFHLPRLGPGEIKALGGKSFGGCAAQALNLLFNTHLTGYDVEFAIGRYGVRLEKHNQRIVLAECWHNPQWRFSALVQSLTDLVSQDSGMIHAPGDWASVGIRIAVLFGICGELIRNGLAGENKTVDISLLSGDFTWPVSAWYAREMGLPIGNIVCCCNENANLWDFICHGQLRTDVVAKHTSIPEADIAVPLGLEWLIAACGGTAEVNKYLEKLRTGGSYFAEEPFLRQLRRGIYVTVNSENRILDAVQGAYQTHGCLLSSTAALAYAGLLDYRARTGESGYALVISETSPVCDVGFVSQALGISEERLKSYLK